MSESSGSPGERSRSWSEDSLAELFHSMKGLLQRIERELDAPVLSRKPIRSALLEFERDLERAGIRGVIHFLRASKASKPLSSSVGATEDNHFLTGLSQMVTSQRRKITSILAMIDRPQKYDDSQIRKSLERFTREGQRLVTLFEELLPDQGLSGRAVIAELISSRPAGLDENWAAAVCFLSAFQIVVNQKFRSMGLKAPNNGKFQTRFLMVTTNLKSQGAAISELDSLLSGAFWGLRNKIIHEGYCPTHGELREIVTWVRTVFAVL